MIRLLLCLLLLCQGSAWAANTWYVATNGTPIGTGSSGNPWDFQTALNKVGVILPGDLVWMRNGIYAHAPQNSIPGVQEGYIFQSTVSGTPSGQTTFRSYPGELARVDGGAFGGVAYGFHACARPTLTVGNSASPSSYGYLTFQDIEFFSSSTEGRLSGDDSSFPTAITRSDGPNIFGTGVKFINCIVHDLSSGISGWRQAQSKEFYGNVVYNNGWQGTPNKHGHSFYMQHSVSASGLATIKRNISMGPYDWGIQAYGSSNTEISRFRISENTFIGNQIAHGGIIIGTRPGGLADRLTDNQILSNFGYGADLAFYFSQPDGNSYRDLVGANNYFYKAFWELSSWKVGTFTNNWIISPALLKVVDLYPNMPGATIPPWTLNRNVYVVSSVGAPVFGVETEAPRTFAQWQARTGYDANSTLATALPAGTNYVIVQGNIYDTNRAHVANYNWTLGNFAAIDVSTLSWGMGSTVMVRNAQNYFVDVVTNQITSTNTLVVDMRSASHSMALPYGDTTPTAPMTFPDFGAFVLIRMGTGTNVPPIPPQPPTTSFTLTVNSSNPSSGVFVQMAPADKNGASNGSTPFTRQVLTNTITQLTAPLRSGPGTTFQKWQRNGVDYENNLVTTFTNSAATTMTCIYLSLGPTPPGNVPGISYRRGARQ